MSAQRAETLDQIVSDGKHQRGKASPISPPGSAKPHKNSPGWDASSNMDTRPSVRMLHTTGNRPRLGFGDFTRVVVSAVDQWPRQAAKLEKRP
jgi:hypothetical protein